MEKDKKKEKKKEEKKEEEVLDGVFIPGFGEKENKNNDTTVKDILENKK